MNGEICAIPWLVGVLVCISRLMLMRMLGVVSMQGVKEGVGYGSELE